MPITRTSDKTAVERIAGWVQFIAFLFLLAWPFLPLATLPSLLVGLVALLCIAVAERYTANTKWLMRMLWRRQATPMNGHEAKPFPKREDRGVKRNET